MLKHKGIMVMVYAVFEQNYMAIGELNIGEVIY